MYIYGKKTFQALLLLVIVVCGTTLCGRAVAQEAPSESETKAFMTLRERFVTAGSKTDYGSVTQDLRQFLEKHPNTIHRKAALSMLFDAYSALRSSCDTLKTFATELLSISTMHFDRHSVAQGYVENDCQIASARQLVQQAIENLEAMPNRSPSTLARYYQTLGNAQRQSGQLSEATASLRRADAILLEEAENVSAPGTGAYDQRRSVLLDLARARMQKGEEEQALALYRNLYRKAPKDTVARRAFEKALRTTGHSREEARRLAEKVRKNAISEALASVEESKLDEELPTFTLPTVRGDSVSLADQRGKVTVISFWAGWCGPCMEEMPFLVDLQTSYENQPFQVLSINLPDNQERYDEIIERYDIEFPILLGDEQVAEDYGVPPIPLTLILDKEGTLRYRHLGFETSALQQEQMRREVEHLLKL